MSSSSAAGRFAVNNRQPRNLGLVRANAARPHSNEDLGLQGAAYNIPQQAQPTPAGPIIRAQKPQQQQLQRQSSSGNDVNKKALEDVKKQLTDALAREKKLKQMVEVLQKQLADVNVSLTSKCQEILDLKAEHEALQSAGDKYKPLYEKEVEDHKVTEGNLQKALHDADQLKSVLEKTTAEHKMEQERLKKDHKLELEDQASAHLKVLQDRDERIERMKKQMAEAFSGNAHERQHQIDELQKEIQKLQDYNHELHRKLKEQQAGSTKSSCSNCSKSKASLSAANKDLIAKDEQMKQLIKIIMKFENQLCEPDKIMAMMAKSNGHNLDPPQRPSKK